jgi:broad specificity phosphatase PhoE
MSQFFLIRHASVDGLGERIIGRTPGVGLNRQGKLDACALAHRLADSGIVAVYTSPRERAQETAAALTRRLDVPTLVDHDLDELDYGDWTGRRFAELQDSIAWHRFNVCREETAIPRGESMSQTAERGGRALKRIGMRHPQGPIALVTHADWIRTVIGHSLGIPFAALLKFQIPTASVTVLELTNLDVRVLAWNDSGTSASFRHH